MNSVLTKSENFNARLSPITSSLESNWAFIDLQNLLKGTHEKGWFIEWNRFRIYLTKHCHVTKAVMFLGRLKENQHLYNLMSLAGFTLEFREVRRLNDGTIDGGNVDADLASYVMDYKTDYTKAIIVADDADYCRTIKSLVRQNKLKVIISSHTMKHTSGLIKQVVNPNMIFSIHSIKSLIANENVA